MFCRRCKRRFKNEEEPVCPYCGESNPQPTFGVLKTSTILISSGRTDAVYRSVKDIPDSLRKKLLKSTNGLNAATILIADRRGREEISRAIRRLPSNVQRRFLQAVLGRNLEAVASKVLKPSTQQAIGIALALASGLLVWLVFTQNW